MSSDPRYIIGELVAVGTPEGSEQPRALVHCTQHDIASVRRLPMLQRVAIVPLELLHGSDAPPIVEENRRLRECVRDFINHCANGAFYAGPVAAGRKLLGDRVDENGMTVAGEVAAARAEKEQKP